MHDRRLTGREDQAGTRRRPPSVGDRPVNVAGPLSPESVLALQRSVGNEVTAQRLAHDDASAGGVDGRGSRPLVDSVLHSPGEPLDDDVRAEAEARMGSDYSDVRVHNDAKAHDAAISVQAYAFTSGTHIAFRRGRYDPRSAAGKRLLYHELGHADDQRKERVPGTDAGGGLRVSEPGDSGERSADARADRAMRVATPVQREHDETAGKPVPGDMVRGVVQRAESDTETEPGPSVRPARTRNVVQREREMSRRYGIRIGPPEGARDGHFGPAVLDRIDTALANLPWSDLGSNEQLEAIEPDTSSQHASAYDPETQTIGIVRPVLFGDVRAPDWLYARLNRGVQWQRRRMDRGAMSNVRGVSRDGDRALGIRSGQREVMAGVSDALAHGNLVEWTVHHEVGHAVDLMVEWERTMSGQEHFGGWQVHSGHEGIEQVARLILQRTNLLGVLPGGDVTAIGTMAVLIEPERRARGNAEFAEARLSSYFDRFRAHLTDQQLTARRAAALRFVRLAFAQPWMLNNGGADVLDTDGRTYHVDQYNSWVSYSTAQRTQYALSNYQFSSPREWFAEAYAAYYDRKPGVRDKLHPHVRDWFASRPGPTETDPAA